MAAVARELERTEACVPRPSLRLVGGTHLVHRAGHRASVYRRRRAVVVALAAAALLVGVVLLAPGRGAPSTEAPGPAGAMGVRTIVVAPGETVWDLVSPHAPAGRDPMAFVVEVATSNDVDPRAVQPGTVLRLPPAD